MKIAICQMEIQWENKLANYDRINMFCTQAKREKAELVLFPEMSVTGFSMNTAVTADKDNETVKRMQEIAKDLEIAVGIGWVKKSEKVKNKCENHYTIVGRHGNILSDYIKIHPFSYSGEDEKFVGGDKVFHFDMGDTIFTSLICYDLRFPEVFQIASRKAEVLIVPACWPKRRRMHWNSLLKARAIENQCYIIGINCAGLIGGIEYSGDSQVITPNGDCILIADEGREQILFFELENDVDKYRKEFPVKKDRREELYLSL